MGVDYAAGSDQTVATISVDKHTMIVVVRTPPDRKENASSLNRFEINAQVIFGGEAKDLGFIGKYPDYIVDMAGKGEILYGMLMRVFGDVASLWVGEGHPSAPLPQGGK